ncbi:MAG: hypothetical protein JXB32_22980 [Deltaproteobacteria bacterium]|nr:hypothetical protein [Deltaproteobacteria bacterium]
MRWSVGIAGLVAVGCASGFDDQADVSEDAADIRSDDAIAGEDGAVDVDPETAQDAAADVPAEVVPDVLEVVDTVEETEVPRPISCSRSGSRDCSAGHGAFEYCPDGPSAFSGAVNSAIDAVIAAHLTEWFSTDGYPASTPLVLPEHVNAYIGAVVTAIQAAGLCAEAGGDEVSVKLNNECSEAWDILANPDASTNLVRRAYMGCCLPAFF